MQAPGDNSITVVDPHVPPYADNNLNEKNLNTQYIYTTEGQLISAQGEITENMDLNLQHYNSVQVTEADGMQIQQPIVEYQQYQEQYSENVQQVPVDTVGDTEYQQGVVVTQQSETTSYTIDQTSQNIYIPDQNAQTVVTTTEQTFTNQTVSEGNQETTYVYETTTVQEGYVAEQPIVTEAEYVSEYAINNPQENQPQDGAGTTQNQEDVESTEHVVDNVQSGEHVNETVENVENIDNVPSKESKPSEPAEAEVVENVDEESVDTVQDNVEKVPDNVDFVQDNVEKVPDNVDFVQDNVKKVPDNVEKVPDNVENVPDNVDSVQYSVEHVQDVDPAKKIENMDEVHETVEENQPIQEAVVEGQEQQTVDHVVVEESETGDVDKNAVANEEKPQTKVESVTENREKDVGEENVDAPAGKPVNIQEQKGETMTVVEESVSTTNEEQAYLAEIREETESRNSTTSTDTKGPRPRRGRKPKTDIPLHILGHDVNKPMDNIVNGKSPKPRLGVKVPYRNLTSQMVTKEEIEKEIVERGKKKMEEKKELTFARRLTHRLAKKLAAGNELQAKKAKQEDEHVQVIQIIEVPSSQNVSESDDSQMEISQDDSALEQKDDSSVMSEGGQESSQGPKDTIDNNSDLLAILEGDGEEMPVLPKETMTQQSITDETNLKNLEREIALQQLQDLPYLSPKTRFVKSRACKELPNLPPGLNPDASKATTSQTGKPTQANANKQNSNKEKTIGKSSEVKKDQDATKQSLEVEPQIKVNMALKTYSRKRKTSENSETSPAPVKKSVVSAPIIDNKAKIDLPITGDVYVTKSSRIIKKKVIWDPDEIPTRSLFKVSPIKADLAPQPKPSPKPSASKNLEKPSDKSTELSKVVEKKLSEDKTTVVKEKVEKKVEEKPTMKKPVASPKPTPSASVKESKEDKDKKSPGNKTGMKYKKTRSEVDKLLGDEGAIKMLYELKNSDEAEEKRKKTVISVERTFKELAKKANEIKSDLVSTSTVESPKSLRKKESFTVSPIAPPKPPPPPPTVPSGITRQKSKDSSRSTPPQSPSFNFPNETSYLIRRRSSSSISSGEDTEDRELDDVTERVTRKKSASTSSSDHPKPKKSKKNLDSKELEKHEENEAKPQKKAENRLGQFKTFNLKKINKNVTIDLHAENTGCYFTEEVLDELTIALTKIAKEKDCNAVLIRSRQEKTFCRGLDYKSLVCDKDTVRKNKASDLADGVGDFIRCLLHFPKVLVAGIQGECIGLAVTMLPLFDIVIASDSATFSTPYSTLGSVAEAGFLLTVPHVTSHGLAGELFYASQTLTADEAFRRGLISKLCWPEKYQDTIKQTLNSISKGSKQSLESTKKQLRTSIMDQTEADITSMSKQLIDHWTSNECQKNFAKIE